MACAAACCSAGPSDVETAAIFLPDTDEARVLASLSARALLDGPVQHANGFAYFRLPPPARVSFKDELTRLTGVLEPEPSDLWVTHPFECWIAPDARAPAGKQRPHALLPVDIVDAVGEPIAAALGVEVRTLPANAPYLLLALANAGFVRPLLRILD